MKKNEREKEQEGKDNNGLIARNEPKINEMKFEEGGPERKKQNK